MLLWKTLCNGWVRDTITRIMQRTTNPVTWRFGYEKSGLTVEDQPAAWNADAALADASFIPTANASRQPCDYQLRFAHGAPVPAISFIPRDGTPLWRLRFKLPVPTQSAPIDLLYRNNPVARSTIPVLTQEQFLSRVELQIPSVYALLGDHCVACQSFVSTQCRGLLTSAVLAGPYPLLPLVDLGLHVELRSEDREEGQRTDVAFNAAQLLGRQALVTVAPRTWPRKIGSWTISWHLNGKLLKTLPVQAISQREFVKSLYIADRKLVLHDPDGRIELSPNLVPGASRSRVGPCFIVASQIAGMAGLCDFQLRTSVPGAFRSPLMLSHETLVTDRPTMVAPGTLDPQDAAQISGFELSTRGQELGMLPLRPLPVASFNAEGSIKDMPELTWDTSAEEALQAALNRLLSGGAVT